MEPRICATHIRHPARHRQGPPAHRRQRHRPPPRRPPLLRPPDRQPQPPQTSSHPTRTRRRNHHPSRTRHPRPASRGRQRRTAQKRRHLLIEKLLEGDEQKQQEPTTIPTLQATEDDATHPDPCNIPTPAVTLSPACRAATHLRSLPSAIGATRRPAESSHASLKT